MFGLFSERRRAAEAMQREKQQEALEQLFGSVLPEEVALIMLNQDKRNQLVGSDSREDACGEGRTIVG